MNTEQAGTLIVTVHDVKTPLTWEPTQTHWCAGNAVFRCLHCALINNQECLKYSLLSMITKTHLPTGVHHFLWEGVVVCFFIMDRSGSAAIVALSQSRKIVATCFAFALVVTWCVKVSVSKHGKSQKLLEWKMFCLRRYSSWREILEVHAIKD